MNQDWKQVQEGLREQGYLCDDGVAVLVYITQQLKKPLLVEGPAGVGKTELAKAISLWLKAPLIRLQCYEGLDEAKALYEWNYRKQLLSIQAGFGSKEDWQTLEHDLFTETFLISRPLLQAITAPQPSVLLIDEIDKVDQEFEALLLEVLSDWQISIPELGTVNSRVEPTVVLTSNNTRELSEALKRRCFYIYLDYPPPARELAIIRTKLPGIDEDLAQQVVEYAQLLRRKDLKKPPSIAEVIDWARTLVQLNITRLEDEAAREVLPTTLPVLVKYRRDLDKSLEALKELRPVRGAGG
ncbi:MAG: MoxR family ATPase [Firmicutes bacterium]|nr:MoxR family ATPase [Bacillota bacterium]